MPEYKNPNYQYHDYNGQKLTINAIAKLEGISDTSLRNHYANTQDINEAVRLAKDGRQKRRESIIELNYNDKVLSLGKIAELEGVTDAALSKYYAKTQDIYEAVRLAKEGQIRKKDSITQIPYNGQMLSITAIGELEKIDNCSLKKYYEETQDINEAVRLAKEGQAKQQERLTKIPYNGQMLSVRAIAKLEGLPKSSLQQRYAETKDIYEAVKLTKEGTAKIKRILYNGQIQSIDAIAKIEGVASDSLRNNFYKFKDIYEAIKITKERQQPWKSEKPKSILYNGQELSLPKIAELESIAETTLNRKYKETQDIYEAVKLAKESKERKKESVSQVSYNGKICTITEIAKIEEIDPAGLRKKYAETQDIYEAIKLTREKKHTRISYNGQIYTISEIARLEGVNPLTLKGKFEKTHDIDKAIMLSKLIRSKTERRREIVQTKEFGNLTYYDVSLIVGIKYSVLEKLLDQGNSIDDIINSKEIISKTSTPREKIKLENGQSLNEYCIENKLNYNCIYRAMKTYGKTLEEAVASYNANGQVAPSQWIYEKYGLLLRHLMLKESIDIHRVVTYMRNDYLPLEEATEKYIIRSNAEKTGLEKYWMEELYDVLADDSLSKEDYDGYVQTFYVDDQEENCIKKSKEQFNNIKRKLLLFELSEVLEEGIFSPEEEKRLFEEYNITEDEVDVIFKDLYKRFTDPGVLMGKDQEEVITPETEQKRDEKINKYKQMVREIKEDNNITFLMRFMVGPNVESNEEYRNELNRELQKQYNKGVTQK